MSNAIWFNWSYQPAESVNLPLGRRDPDKMDSRRKIAGMTRKNSSGRGHPRFIFEGIPGGGGQMSTTQLPAVDGSDTGHPPNISEPNNKEVQLIVGPLVSEEGLELSSRSRDPNLTVP
jgi:hypothetical protein